MQNLGCTGFKWGFCYGLLSDFSVIFKGIAGFVGIFYICCRMKLLFV